MAKIILHNVSLDYPLYDISQRSIKTNLLRKVGSGLASRNGVVCVEALKNISLNLNDGDRLAIVGHNGAGKSTLLKVLAGIYEPMIGYVYCEGSRSSLTDVTMGMNPDATGYENIVMRAIFLGMTKNEINRRLVEIAEFSELGEYLSLPVRSYSTGMLVRLGFSVTTSIRPEILIMDEMIGAGDLSFAEKASHRIKEYVDGSKILVLASHNNDMLRQFCNKAVLMSGGSIALYGTVDEVISAYQSEFCR